MRIFNADEKINGETNNLLQRIKYKISKSEPGSFVYFRLYTIKDGNKIEYKEKFSNVAVFEELKQLGAIEILSRGVDEINKSRKENEKTKKEVIMEEGYLVRPIEPKFSELCREYEKRVKTKIGKTNISEHTRKNNLLFTKEAKLEINAGKLASYSDGTIRYGDKILPIRSQLKELCRLFLNHQNRLLTLDDIKEEIIRANRRTIIKFITISKYVSELHNILRVHFGQDVIFNHKEEGWDFRPPK